MSLKERVESLVTTATRGGEQEFAIEVSMIEFAEFLSEHIIPTRGKTIVIEVLGTFWLIETRDEGAVVLFKRHFEPMRGYRSYRPQKTKMEWDVWWLKELAEHDIPLHDPSKELANLPGGRRTNSF